MEKENQLPQHFHTQLHYYRPLENSDKLYNIWIEEKSPQNELNLFYVRAEYGRRGSTLKQLSKTTEPTDFNTAYYVLKQNVDEKVSEGYEMLTKVPLPKHKPQEKFDLDNLNLTELNKFLEL